MQFGHIYCLFFRRKIWKVTPWIATQSYWSRTKWVSAVCFWAAAAGSGVHLSIMHCPSAKQPRRGLWGPARKALGPFLMRLNQSVYLPHAVIVCQTKMILRLGFCTTLFYNYVNKQSICASGRRWSHQEPVLHCAGLQHNRLAHVFMK